MSEWLVLALLLGLGLGFLRGGWWLFAAVGG